MNAGFVIAQTNNAVLPTFCSFLAKIGHKIQGDNAFGHFLVVVQVTNWV